MPFEKVHGPVTPIKRFSILLEQRMCDEIEIASGVLHRFEYRVHLDTVGKGNTSSTRGRNTTNRKGTTRNYSSWKFMSEKMAQNR